MVICLAEKFYSCENVKQKYLASQKSKKPYQALQTCLKIHVM